MDPTYEQWPHFIHQVEVSRAELSIHAKATLGGSALREPAIGRPTLGRSAPEGSALGAHLYY